LGDRHPHLPGSALRGRGLAGVARHAAQAAISRSDVRRQAFFEADHASPCKINGDDLVLCVAAPW